MKVNITMKSKIHNIAIFLFRNKIDNVYQSFNMYRP